MARRGCGPASWTWFAWRGGGLNHNTLRALLVAAVVVVLVRWWPRCRGSRAAAAVVAGVVLPMSLSKLDWANKHVVLG